MEIAAIPAHLHFPLLVVATTVMFAQHVTPCLQSVVKSGENFTRSLSEQSGFLNWVSLRLIPLPLTSISGV